MLLPADSLYAVCSFSTLQSMVLSTLSYLSQIVFIPGVVGWFLVGGLLRVCFPERRT